MGQIVDPLAVPVALGEQERLQWLRERLHVLGMECVIGEPEELTGWVRGHAAQLLLAPLGFGGLAALFDRRKE